MPRTAARRWQSFVGKIELVYLPVFCCKLT
jgi:hypothetical protein